MAEIVEQRIFTSLAIARLRRLNRYSHLGCAQAKERTLEVSQDPTSSIASRDMLNFFLDLLNVMNFVVMLFLKQYFISTFSSCCCPVSTGLIHSYTALCDFTVQKRSENDQYHLKLQNLMYEVGHLQKEINKCLEFRSVGSGSPKLSSAFHFIVCVAVSQSLL